MPGGVMALFTYDFAFVGGDTRFIYMAEFLDHKGYKIIIYAPSDGKGLPDCPRAESLEEAVSQARTIIGGIPFTSGNMSIRHTGKKEDMTTTKLLSVLKENQILFAGCLKQSFIKECADKNVMCFDFMADDKVTIYNTIATAEGAIAEAVMCYPDNIHGSKSLVIGYGKCGKSLAERLKGLYSETTVCTRSTVDREWARANGHKTISFETLGDKIGEYHLIFNTVPKMILDKKLLYAANSNSIILDIASAPGGVDYKVAKKLGMNARLYPSLPGKYAPKASGNILGYYVISTISQMPQSNKLRGI